MKDSSERQAQSVEPHCNESLVLLTPSAIDFLLLLVLKEYCSKEEKYIFLLLNYFAL